jgi:hypothetical protein
MAGAGCCCSGPGWRVRWQQRREEEEDARGLLLLKKTTSVSCFDVQTPGSQRTKDVPIGRRRRAPPPAAFRPHAMQALTSSLPAAALPAAAAAPAPRRAAAGARASPAAARAAASLSLSAAGPAHAARAGRAAAAPRRVRASATAAEDAPAAAAERTYEANLDKPLGIKFARGRDGGAYVISKSADPRYDEFEIGDKIVEVRCALRAARVARVVDSGEAASGGRAGV